MCTTNISGDYSKYKLYIGPVGQIGSYRQVGRGWSTYFEIVSNVPPEGYSFKTHGVSSYLKIQKIQAQMFDKKELLSNELQKMEPNQSKAFAFIASELRGKSEMYFASSVHVISLFAQRRDNRLLLFINDSVGDDYSYKKVRKALNVTFDIQLFVSRVVRQVDGYMCQSFAIRDCKKFDKDPYLIDRMLALNRYVNEKRAESFPILNLPESLDVRDEQMKEKAQKYFNILVNHLINR